MSDHNTKDLQFKIEMKQILENNQKIIEELDKRSKERLEQFQEDMKKFISQQFEQLWQKTMSIDQNNNRPMAIEDSPFGVLQQAIEITQETRPIKQEVSDHLEKANAKKLKTLRPRFIKPRSVRKTNCGVPMIVEPESEPVKKPAETPATKTRKRKRSPKCVFNEYGHVIGVEEGEERFNCNTCPKIEKDPRSLDSTSSSRSRRIL
ncbi:unnamed protein product [Caenorhabditis angaria]|uniref:Uncharacterized protein n=1 Tax=Caenorhabditis angaria TaxID=860376 RepID=A0A9P1I6Y0_9PELO|nr:unnamed protein product [Caenorhabditis angaria]